MSRSRAKKKQRRRARAAEGAAGAGEAAGRERAASREPAREPAERPPRPSRLDVRDGVARPEPPWAPFPLTELGMVVGIALFGIGFASGATVPFLAGVGVLTVVVAEFTLREHMTGFRSHSILLGLLPVTAVHLAVVYFGGVTWRGPVALALDLAVAAALAVWLQRRFVAAQARARGARR